jgi:hypothetical protein
MGEVARPEALPAPTTQLVTEAEDARMGAAPEFVTALANACGGSGN